MKRALFYGVRLLMAAGVCALLMLAFWPSDAVRKGGVLVSLGLLLTAYVAFIQHGIVASLCRWVRHSPLRSLALPLTLLVPYLIYAVATETLRWDALGRLGVYAVAPSLILLVGSREPYPPRITWPDAVAMLAVAAPVPAGWLWGAYGPGRWSSASSGRCSRCRWARMPSWWCASSKAWATGSDGGGGIGPRG